MNKGAVFRPETTKKQRSRSMYSVTVSVGTAALLFVLLVMVCLLVRRRNLQSNKDVKRCIQSKGKHIP